MPAPTIVEIITPRDTVAFYPTPDVNGFVYNNETLDRWYALADVETRTKKRPNAHGAYGLGQVFTKEHNPVISGQYYGTSSAAALVARKRLSALFNDGESVTMRVTDELETTTREVWLGDFDAPFHYGFDHFDFDIVFTAPDSRRYGSIVTGGPATLPTAGGGLHWNLGTAPSTLYFDWGLAGATGQVSFTNGGASTTYPTITVGGAGAFAAGFRITEIETGRELTYQRETVTGDVVTFDSRTGRATLQNGGDVTKWLSSRDWFEIPAGETRRYQINSLGAVTGSPTMTVYAAPAYL